MRNYALNIKGYEFAHLQVMENYPDFQKGLDDREHLAEDEGVIYVLPDTRGTFFFSNGNPHIALDLVLLGEDGVILLIQTMQPAPRNPDGTVDESKIPTYGRDLPVQFGFEFAAGTAARLGLQVGQRLSIDLKPLLQFCCAPFIHYSIGQLQVWSDTSWYEEARSLLRRSLQAGDDVDALDRMFCGAILKERSLLASGWKQHHFAGRGFHCLQKSIWVRDWVLAFQCCLAPNGMMLQFRCHSWKENVGFGKQPIAVLHEETFNELYCDLMAAQTTPQPATLEDELRAVVFRSKALTTGEVPSWEQWRKALQQSNKAPHSFWIHRMAQGISRFPKAEMPLACWYDLFGALGAIPDEREQRLAQRLLLWGMEERQYEKEYEGWEALSLGFHTLGQFRYAFHCACNEFALRPRQDLDIPVSTTGFSYLRELFQKQKYREALKVVSSILTVGFQEDIPMKVWSDLTVVTEHERKPYQTLAALALCHIGMKEYSMASMVCDMAIQHWTKLVESGKVCSPSLVKEEDIPQCLPLIWQYRGLAEDGKTDLVSSNGYQGFIQYANKVYPLAPLEAPTNQNHIAFLRDVGAMDLLVEHLLPKKDRKKLRKIYETDLDEEMVEVSNHVALPEMFQTPARVEEIESIRIKPDPKYPVLQDCLWFITRNGKRSLELVFPTFCAKLGETFIRRVHSIHPWSSGLAGHVTVFLNERICLPIFLPEFQVFIARHHSDLAYPLAIAGFAWDIRRIPEVRQNILGNPMATFVTKYQGLLTCLDDFIYHGAIFTRVLLQFRTPSVEIPFFVQKREAFSWLHGSTNVPVEISGMLQGWFDYDAKVSNEENRKAFLEQEYARTLLTIDKTLPTVVQDTKFNLAALCEQALYLLADAKNVRINPDAFSNDLYASCEIKKKVVTILLMTGFFESSEEAFKRYQLIKNNPQMKFSPVGIFAVKEEGLEGYSVRYLGFQELLNGG